MLGRPPAGGMRLVIAIPTFIERNRLGVRGGLFGSLLLSRLDRVNAEASMVSAFGGFLSRFGEAEVARRSESHPAFDLTLVPGLADDFRWDGKSEQPGAPNCAVSAGSHLEIKAAAVRVLTSGPSSIWPHRTR